MKNEPIDAEVQRYLELYSVDFPNEDEMESSIAMIMAHAPKKKNRLRIVQNGAVSLLQNSMRELLHFDAAFWVLNAIFLTLGAVTLIEQTIDPYMMAFILAPLPFISALYEIFKSRDEGLMELEMSLKYSTQQIMMSRLLMVGVFNLMMNTVLWISFSIVYPDLLFSKLLISWTVPYVLVTSISFLFAMSVKSSISSGIVTAVWVSFCYWALQVETFQNMVVEMDSTPAAIGLLTGILLWVIGIRNMKKMNVRSAGYEA
ncbi:hypothetical protein ACFQPF_07925 [Fictibacillus iocasae]|uniref:Uncharacterized protein n=1 Tax=Fictibacillus iocasae TaxID=2715437 RepID=A0ABW2NME7_9BACL